MGRSATLIPGSVISQFTLTISWRPLPFLGPSWLDLNTGGDSAGRPQL